MDPYGKMWQFDDVRCIFESPVQVFQWPKERLARVGQRRFYVEFASPSCTTCPTFSSGVVL